MSYYILSAEDLVFDYLCIGLKAEDLLWAGLTDTYAKLPMGLTGILLFPYYLSTLLLFVCLLQKAEKLAEKYGISRKECDAFGVRSQNLYQVAAAANVFNAEIASVEVKCKKGKELVIIILVFFHGNSLRADFLAENR